MDPNGYFVSRPGTCGLLNHFSWRFRPNSCGTDMSQKSTHLCHPTTGKRFLIVRWFSYLFIVLKPPANRGTRDANEPQWTAWISNLLGDLWGLEHHSCIWDWRTAAIGVEWDSSGWSKCKFAIKLRLYTYMDFIMYMIMWKYVTSCYIAYTIHLGLSTYMSHIVTCLDNGGRSRCLFQSHTVTWSATQTITIS